MHHGILSICWSNNSMKRFENQTKCSYESDGSGSKYIRLENNIQHIISTEYCDENEMNTRLFPQDHGIFTVLSYVFCIQLFFCNLATGYNGMVFNQ